MSLKCRCPKRGLSQATRHKRKGSASILVIMILLLLVSFGVLALMSGYAHYKISKKNAQWTQGYYALENCALADAFPIFQVVNRLRDDGGAQSLPDIQEALTEALAPLNAPVYAIYPSADAQLMEVGFESTLELDTQVRAIRVRVGINPHTLSEAPLGLEILEWKELPKAFIYEELEFGTPKENGS